MTLIIMHVKIAIAMDIAMLNADVLKKYETQMRLKKKSNKNLKILSIIKKNTVFIV